MTVVIYVVLFWAGALLGFFLSWWMMSKLKSYSGVIIAIPDEVEDKIVYSLILFNNPENLIYQKEVLFRVDTEVEEDDRG
jgi:hypothetical protein